MEAPLVTGTCGRPGERVHAPLATVCVAVCQTWSRAHFVCVLWCVLDLIRGLRLMAIGGVDGAGDGGALRSLSTTPTGAAALNVLWHIVDQLRICDPTYASSEDIVAVRVSFRRLHTAMIRAIGCGVNGEASTA